MEKVILYLKSNLLMRLVSLSLIVISVHTSHELYASDGTPPSGIDITIDTLKNIVVLLMSIMAFVPTIFSYREKKNFVRSQELANEEKALLIREKEIKIIQLEEELRNGKK